MGTCKLCLQQYDLLKRHLENHHDNMFPSTYKRLASKVAPISELVKPHKKNKNVTWGSKISESKQGMDFNLAGWNKGLTKETNNSVRKIAENEVRNEKIRQANIGREITWADKISKTKSDQCKDPEFVRDMMARFGNRKTRPEAKLEEILNESFPNQWAYGGDGSFIISGKSPDFVNVDGKKQIIEVFGRYWHKEIDVKERQDCFAKFGFSTLIFWDNELSDKETVINRINHFPSVETVHELSNNSDVG